MAMTVLMRRRQARVLARLEQMLMDDGRREDAAVISAVRRNDDAMEMFHDEATVAFARAEGLDASALEERGRPFLDFLQAMIDAQVFRKFVEYVLDNPEKFLELAKMIAAIIGVFA